MGGVVCGCRPSLSGFHHCYAYLVCRIVLVLGGYRPVSFLEKDYQDYAELCFKEFGDRVKYWVILNEPWSYSLFGYANGRTALGRCSAWMNSNYTGGDSAIEPYLVSHHQLLAHATVFGVYKTKYQASQKGLRETEYWVGN